MANKIFAIDAAPEAIPPNPKIAAMIAITKNVTVQRNIILKFKCDYNFYTNQMNENNVPFFFEGRHSGYGYHCWGTIFDMWGALLAAVYVRFNGIDVAFFHYSNGVTK